MNGVINFEYLISAALHEPSYFNRAVHGVRLLFDIYSDELGFLYVENDIILKMQGYGYFPSKDIFQSVVSKMDEEPVFGADDIARMINVFLSKAIHFDESKNNCIVEWEKDVETLSEICAISNERKKQVTNQLLNHAIQNKFSNIESSVLYYNESCPLKKTSATFNGEIKEAYPFQVNQQNKCFTSLVEVFSSIEDYLLKLDGYELYKSATCSSKYKLAFFIGALKLMKENNLQGAINWDDFKVGDSFMASLIENECDKDRRYGSVTYEAVINFLAKSGKNDVNYFYRSDSITEPRRIGHFTAYRVHITKGGRALRLLAWKNEKNDSWIISNVGNKSELQIANP